MPIELMSMLGGGVVGFFFRYLAQKAQDQKEMFNRLLTANKVDTENQDKAATRVPLDIGKTIRQIIIIVILFGTIVAPFVLPFFGVPLFVEVDTTSPEAVFGIIPSVTNKFFVELNGFLYTPENRQILLSIVGFYFGSAVGGNKT